MFSHGTCIQHTSVVFLNAVIPKQVFCSRPCSCWHPAGPHTHTDEKAEENKGNGIRSILFPALATLPSPPLAFWFQDYDVFSTTFHSFCSPYYVFSSKKMEGEELNLFVKNIENIMSVTEKVRCSAKLLSSEHTHDPVSCSTKIQPMSTSPIEPLLIAPCPGNFSLLHLVCKRLHDPWGQGPLSRKLHPCHTGWLNVTFVWVSTNIIRRLGSSDSFVLCLGIQ